MAQSKKNSICKITKNKKYHFTGIGGVGNSGLAKLLSRYGAKVTGSDSCDSEVIQHLRGIGVEVTIGQCRENINDKIDALVYSAAVKEDNPEIQAAKDLGIKTYKYAQMLGLVMDHFRGIAICGTHGKSTTSGWLSYLLTEANLDPSWIVGALIPQLGDSNAAGSGEYFVAEACEYDRSFHNLHPKVGVILNIEQDHLDYYKDEAEIIESFGKFACGCSEDAVIIANGADINVIRALEPVKDRLDAKKIKVETFGFGTKYDFSPANITERDGLSEFDVLYKSKNIGRAEISLPGHHNILNALAVVAAAFNAGVEPAVIFENIGKFTGVDRRLMLKAQLKDITIMDDYAHHPTEVRVALRAVRDRYNPKRLFCVFEPHQYSRTRFLLDDFAQSFKLADMTVIPEIYFVRDTEQMKKQVNSEMLVGKITAAGSKAVFIPGFSNIVEYLKENVETGDLVLTMGAGNIWKVADEYIHWLRNNS